MLASWKDLESLEMRHSQVMEGVALEALPYRGYAADLKIASRISYGRVCHGGILPDGGAATKVLGVSWLTVFGLRLLNNSKDCVCRADLRGFVFFRFTVALVLDLLLALAGIAGCCVASDSELEDGVAAESRLSSSLSSR